MTFSLDTATLPQMKAFAAANKILITGDKRIKENWAGCIKKWQYVAIASASAKQAADAIAVQADDVAEIVVVKTVEVLTSPTAITVYKTIFHAVALVVALVVLMSWRLIKWGWAHRSDTALAHWIVTLKGSTFGHQGRVWFRWSRRTLSREWQSVVMFWMVDRLDRVGGPVS